MSYDIDLTDPVTHKTLHSDGKHHMRGGTFALGGDTALSLNVTYNYGGHYRRVIDKDKGIRKLYGMTGAESMPVLKSAIERLGDDVSDDYWKPTEGNAKQALCQLLAMAQMRPDGIWGGD